MEMLIIQLPRGRTTVVAFDPETGAVLTTHTGLHAVLRQGIKDWTGQRLFPSDGLPFLSALHDHVFLSGYRVRWLTASTVFRLGNSRRE